MSSTTVPRIDFHTKGQPATDSDVDAWEVKASRRALLNLKTLLGTKHMTELIQPQIDAADAYYKQVIEASNGVYRECVTNLKVHDVKLRQIMAFRQKMDADMATPEGRDAAFLGTFAKMHPEHYAPPNYEDGIIEVIGEHMARVNIDKTSEVPAFVHEYGDPAFPGKKAAMGRLEDGSVLFYILHEFRDTDQGCEANVRLLFPDKAEKVWFEEHAEHLAIEFRAGIREGWRMWEEKQG